MRKPKSKAMRRRNLVIRLYVALLTMILGLSLTALLAQTAFATSYVITDGETVVTCTSFATDPAQVPDQAGVELQEHDTYTTQVENDAENIIVSRGQKITIKYHGKTTGTTSAGETVGELLQRLELEVSGEDVVSHGMEEKTYDGMEITVDRIQVQRETYSATVAHEVRYQRDEEIPEGTRAVHKEGSDGQLLCTADVTYVNGKEIGRTVISEEMTRAPETEIIKIGAGEIPEQTQPQEEPVIGDGYILLPTGEVLTYTRKDTVRATAYTHTDAGCDMITSTGTTVHWGTVAVDPRYIPYGTRMFIMASDGSYIYGLATAEDCGGDIKGDRMDLYMPTYQQCMEFGRRRCTLYFLG